MTNSSNNNDNFNLQQLVDKIKTMVTPEKRAQMITKIKAAWAIINEKPVDIKVDSEVPPLVAQEKLEAKQPEELDKNKL